MVSILSSTYPAAAQKNVISVLLGGYNMITSVETEKGTQSKTSAKALIPWS